MNCKRLLSRFVVGFFLIALVAASALPHSASAQPVSIGVQSSNGLVSVSWPAGLSLVQPQRATNLSAAAWSDFGAATSDSTLTVSAVSGAAFFRLRFLAPMITEDLTNQTVSAGTNVEFKISATGTAPLSYQWQKGGMALGGETAANLSLANTTTNEAGAYSVVISNRAGSVTSAVAILTVIGAPQPVHGIYTGTFVGATNGGFAAMVRSNRAAIVLGYSGPQAEGIFATNFVVAADSTFATATAQGGFVSGAFAGINISGTFTNAIGDSGTFSGARKPDTGIHASNAGYYRGTYSGAFSGNAFAILAADGSIFIFVDGVEAGGFGTVTAARDLSATAGPFGLTGTLNVTTKTLSGSYRYLGNTLGTFSLSRVLAP